MTEETRPVLLGGRTFDVPLLPLRYNRVIYPLCRDLSIVPEGSDPMESFEARVLKSRGSLNLVRDDEWPKLEQIAFNGALAADKTLTREQFDDLPILPTELINAFFAIRLRTGAWIKGENNDVAQDGDAAPGEATGADSPQ